MPFPYFISMERADQIYLHKRTFSEFPNSVAFPATPPPQPQESQRTAQRRDTGGQRNRHHKKGNPTEVGRISPVNKGNSKKPKIARTPTLEANGILVAFNHQGVSGTKVQVLELTHPGNHSRNHNRIPQGSAVANDRVIQAMLRPVSFQSEAATHSCPTIGVHSCAVRLQSGIMGQSEHRTGHDRQDECQTQTLSQKDLHIHPH